MAYEESPRPRSRHAQHRIAPFRAPESAQALLSSFAKPAAVPDEGLMKSFVKNCLCTEKQIKTLFTIGAVLTGIVTLTLVLYGSSTKRVKRWLMQKQALRAGVRGFASKTAGLVTSRKAADPTRDEGVLAWMADLERRRMPGQPESFLFVLDSAGGLWAHGVEPCSERGKPVSGWDGHDACGGDGDGDGDDYDEDDKDGGGWRTPPCTTVSDVVCVCRRGGGFVHFRRDGRLMVAHVCSVRGTDLLLGGAMAVPHNQRGWEEANWMRDCKRRRRRRRRGRGSR
jgi:hypothetical protein